MVERICCSVTQMFCRIYYIFHKAVLLRRRTTVWIKPSPSLWHYKSKFGLGHLATPTIEEKECFLQQKDRVLYMIFVESVMELNEFQMASVNVSWGSTLNILKVELLPPYISLALIYTVWSGCVASTSALYIVPVYLTQSTVFWTSSFVNLILQNYIVTISNIAITVPPIIVLICINEVSWW